MASGNRITDEDALPGNPPSEWDVADTSVLDVQGRRVAVRDSERFEGGRHRVAWSPPPLASGDYFLRVITGSGESGVQRWTVLR